MHWNRFMKQANADPVLARQGAGSGFRLLLGWGDNQYLISVRGAVIVTVQNGPFVMPQCDFALNGSSDAWGRFASPRPAPREQDIFSRRSGSNHARSRSFSTERESACVYRRVITGLQQVAEQPDK